MEDETNMIQDHSTAIVKYKWSYAKSRILFGFIELFNFNRVLSKV